MFGSPAVGWRALGSTLSLTPYDPTATFAFGASFRQVKRLLGVPADGLSFRHHLYGTRNGVEIVVHSFDVGAGSNSTTYTGVLARVDPPLFLGFGLREKGYFEKLFGTPRVVVGDATADQKLYIDAHDPRRAAELLSPNDAAGAELLRRSVALLPWYLHVTDSTVLVAEVGTITDPARVSSWIDHATALARAFATRHAALPPTAWEAALHEQWTHFAETHRFTFDAPRMKLDGVLAGTHIEIALETAGPDAFTAVTAHFPQALGVAFAALRTAVPGFLQGIFSQDIRVGHSAFDDAYKVTGQPEDAVREIFRRPGLADQLAFIASRTGDAQMNHRSLYFRLPGAVTRSEQLHAIAEVVRGVSEGIFGAMRDAGPYR